MGKEFDPNQVSFHEGAVRVEAVARKLCLDRSKIMTSRDDNADQIRKALPVTNVPEGFSKHQLPFVFDKGQFFITDAPAGAKVSEHSHDEGDGLRFICGGSVIHDGVELKAGDWMFIPQGVRYSLTIGSEGATMCYCYQCCCAGAKDVIDYVVRF